MTLELGIDFGSYTPNTTVGRLRCCAEKFGVEWASIGLQGNTFLHTQIDVAVRAELNVDTYLIPLSWYRDPVPLVTRQLERIEQYKGKIDATVWFDVESLPGENPGPSTVLPWTRTAIRLIEAAGWRAGIYTSRAMWASLTGNTHEFASYPLWEAFYAPYRAYTPHSIGGWAVRAGVQWQGSTLLCELNVDLNTWEAKEQTMTDEQIKALIGETLALSVRTQAAIEQERADRAAADSFQREVLIELAEGHGAKASKKLRDVYAFTPGATYPYP